MLALAGSDYRYLFGWVLFVALRWKRMSSLLNGV